MTNTNKGEFIAIIKFNSETKHVFWFRKYSFLLNSIMFTKMGVILNRIAIREFCFCQNVSYTTFKNVWLYAYTWIQWCTNPWSLVLEVPNLHIGYNLLNDFRQNCSRLMYTMYLDTHRVYILTGVELFSGNNYWF